MQLDYYKKVYLIGLNLIILLILSVGLLSTPVILWWGLLRMTLESNSAGNIPEYLITTEYILLIIFLPLCLALYFPILKLLSRRFKAVKKFQEFFLPHKPYVKDRFIMGLVIVLAIIVALAFDKKTFLCFIALSSLAVVARMYFILTFPKREISNPSGHMHSIEIKLNLLKNWIRFLAVIFTVTVIILFKVLSRKF
ncbi:MAG: hypothetical protein V1674_05965 [Candidatus Omnitrophota bacterium]